MGAVFYEPGTIDPETGPAIAVDEPCLLQLRERADGTVATVADPTGTCSSVAVTVGDESWQVPLADCAQGRKAGTTVSLGEVQVAPE